MDIEVVTDHAIFATLYRIAARQGIRAILSGTNGVTEQVMPPHWIYNKTDHVNIRAIHKEFATVPLKTYPFVDLKVKKYYQLMENSQPLHSQLRGLRQGPRQAAHHRGTGLGDYGGKHYESIFTRFYQGCILPAKVGIDKRKAHLSNLIFAGQITKQQALVELAEPIYPADQLASDHEFVLKKLELTEPEFAGLMSRPPRPHTDFAAEQSVYDAYPVLRPFRGAAEILKSVIPDSRRC